MALNLDATTIDLFCRFSWDAYWNTRPQARVDADAKSQDPAAPYRIYLQGTGFDPARPKFLGAGALATDVANRLVTLASDVTTMRNPTIYALDPKYTNLQMAVGTTLDTWKRSYASYVQAVADSKIPAATWAASPPAVGSALWQKWALLLTAGKDLMHACWGLATAALQGNSNLSENCLKSFLAGDTLFVAPIRTAENARAQAAADAAAKKAADEAATRLAAQAAAEAAARAAAEAEATRVAAEQAASAEAARVAAEQQLAVASAAVDEQTAIAPAVTTPAGGSVTVPATPGTTTPSMTPSSTPKQPAWLWPAVGAAAVVGILMFARK